MKVLELFAGIGACSKALTRLGIKHEIVDAVEIDKYAMASFNAIHGTNFETQDITTWDKDIEVDLIMHGSPCQDFSIAGKQAGGDVGSGTRSSLMYETIRIVGKLRPKYVIWENVKNVLSTKHKHNFENYLTAMQSLGYTNYYQVLNAKDYGIPQNRERVFTVSILGSSKFEFPKEHIRECEVINPLKDISGKSWQFEQNVYSEDSILRTLKAGGGSGNIPKVIENFEFPPKQELKLRLKDLLEDEVDEKYYLSEKMLSGFLKHNEKHEEKGTGFIWKPKTENDIANCLRANASLCPTDNTLIEPPFIVASRGRNPENPSDRTAGKPTEQRLEPKYDGTTNTITTVQKDNYVIVKNATQKGYQEAFDGDSVNLSFPNSTTRRGRVGKQVAQTLQCNDNMGVVVKNIQELNGVRIRKLTPKECWRLMGFDDEDFEKAERVNSNTQLYKQAGNSIVVNVLEAIFRNLLK